jgi:hypothetical protein
MMRRVEMWLWTIEDAFTGKPRVSRRRMSVEDAMSLHPGAQRVPGTMAYQDVPISPDAELGVALDAWSRSSKPGDL